MRSGVALLVLVALTAGCGGAAKAGENTAVRLSDDAVVRFKGTTTGVRTVSTGARTVHVPSTVAAREAWYEAVSTRVTGIAESRLAGLTADDARFVLHLACQAKDLYEVGQASSPAEAVEALVAGYAPGAEGFRMRASGLADELTRQDFTDAVGTAASFALCEYV